MVEVAKYATPSSNPEPKSFLRRSLAKPIAQLAVCLTIFLLLFVHSPLIIYEDAFITFRYAENFLGGSGLAFNNGEPPSEGFSNILWLLLLAGANSVGVDFLIASRLLGLILSVSTIAMTFGLSYRISRPLAWMPTLLLLSHPVFVHNTGIGMETSLFSFLLVCSLYVIWDWADNDIRHQITLPANVLAAVLFFLLSLTRPDGFIFPFAFFLLLVVQDTVRQTVDRSRYLWLPAWLGLMVVFELWRLYYFGKPLPNTYYCKVTLGFDSVFERLLAGFEYLARFFAMHPILILLLPLISVLLIRKGVFGAASMATGFVLAYSAFVVDAGGDDPGFFYFRFFAHILPILMVLFLSIPTQLGWGIFKSNNRSSIGLAIALFLGTQLYADDFLSRTGKSPFPSALTKSLWSSIQNPATLIDKARYVFVEFKENKDNSIEFRTALWLNAIYQSNTILAGEQAGQIPYFTKMVFIDLWGLVNPEICAVRKEPTELLKILSRTHPDLIVTSSPYRITGMRAFLEENKMGLKWILQDREWIQDQDWAADRMFIFERDYVPDIRLDSLHVVIEGRSVEVLPENVVFTGGDSFRQVVDTPNRG